MTPAGPGASAGKLIFAVAVSVAVVAGLWTVLDEAPPSSSRFALSPQECTTECQTRQTDCILDCDGAVPCERKCTEVGKACVERCRHPPDAGLAGSAGSGGSNNGGTGAAGRRAPR